MSTRRSASVGALPLEKKHFVSRNESTGGVTLDVRCACQYFQSDSLLPERINPVDSRPSSKLGFHHDQQCLDYEEMLRENPGTISPTMHTMLSMSNMATAPTMSAMSTMQREHPGTISPTMQTMLAMSSMATVPSMPTAPTMPTTPTGPTMSSMTAMQNMTGDRRLLAGDRVMQPEPERQSMRSLGKHRSWDQGSASVDISFVEKYPELEETAKTRGLVVRSISDDDPHQMAGGTHGRQRFTSVDRMSNASGYRDPETLSMHSVRSLRRISRPPSKGDLFVADINIEQPTRQRSVSASRRSSNIDLSHMAGAPHINVITPTPLPQLSDQPPSFQRHFTPIRSPSPPAATEGDVGYRYAKPPISVDYMRPEDNKENTGFSRSAAGETMPQNRPIDMSKYRTLEENSTIVQQSRQIVQPPNISKSQQAPHQAKLRDPLEETVSELEAIAARHNVEDIVDNIKIERLSPPLLEHVPQIPLKVEEATMIDIKTHVNVVDINKLVQEEEEKARNRAKSKSPSRPMQRFSPVRQMEDSSQFGRFSPSRQIQTSASVQKMDRLSPTRQRDQLSPSRQMDSLQLPQQLKRGHSPERQSSPTMIKKMASESEIHKLEDSAKPTYSSRFKSLFTSKPKDEHSEFPEPEAMARERSPSPAPSSLRMSSFLSSDKHAGQHERSPSPAPSAFRMPSMFSKENKNGKHEKSPSPAPQKSKVMSMFSKQMPVASPIVSGTNAVVTNKSQAEPMSIKVQETFSLKVDEMDQYMSKPAKQPAPPAAANLTKSPSVPISMSEREDFPESEHVSMSIREAFAPVIIGRSASSQFSIDQAQLHSEVSSQDRGLNMRSWSKEPSIRQHSDVQSSWSSREPSVHHHPELQGKPLFSAPIMMDSSGSLQHSVSPDRHRHLHGLRSPSEQRPMQQQTKQKFLDGRTQSQDRQPLGGSQENLTSARMTKTVSFHFDERKSRLSEFENRSAAVKQPSQNDYLDRTYFSR